MIVYISTSIVGINIAYLGYGQLNMMKCLRNLGLSLCCERVGFTVVTY